MSSGRDSSVCTIVDGQDVALSSLEGVTTQLAGHILLGGKVIFWHNSEVHFMYISGEDREMWRKQWLDLKKKVCKGCITAVKSDDPITVVASGPDQSMRTPLPPMLEVLKDGDNRVIECPAYFILKQSGDIDLMDYTPYFFTNEASRDDTVSKLSSLIAKTQIEEYSITLC